MSCWVSTHLVQESQNDPVQSAVRVHRLTVCCNIFMRQNLYPQLSTKSDLGLSTPPKKAWCLLCLRVSCRWPELASLLVLAELRSRLYEPAILCVIDSGFTNGNECVSSCQQSFRQSSPSSRRTFFSPPFFFSRGKLTERQNGTMGE